MTSFALLGQSNAGSNSAIVAFVAYIGIVLFLAWLSGRSTGKSGFLNEYFLGGRSLGVWAFALTFAATSASGGSFIGFPSLVYMHGWSVALWISSYMLVPLVAMGLLAKRLNQLARQVGAITIPDIIIERFRSPVLALVATLLIVFFTAFNLVAQFKGGSVILQTLLADVPMFQSTAGQFAEVVNVIPGIGTEVDPGYLLCLLVFAIAVVIYTTYGGFRAVVWTDVLQGIVMLIGIMILLPLTLIAVGGLKKATQDLARSSPPLAVRAVLTLRDVDGINEGERMEAGTLLPIDMPGHAWLQLQEPAFMDGLGNLLPVAGSPTSDTDPSSETLPTAGATDPLVTATLFDTVTSSSDFNVREGAKWDVVEVLYDGYARGGFRPGAFVSLPGPHKDKYGGFLPFSAAISFFFFWCFASAGQPSNMVRCMAFKNTHTLSRAIFTVSIYYSLIYFPIVIIFCCGRVLLPGWEGASDRIMPELTRAVTAEFGVPWLAGLLVAAPFAAVMSTIDSFLLMVSSSVVRDVYGRWINPNPSEKSTKRLTYTTTLLIGLIAMVAAINPPQFLQDIIVFTGAGLATAFLVPVALALYWPRFNAAGALAGMLTGFFTNIALYAIGTYLNGEMSAYEPMGLSPFLIGLFLSLVMAVSVCLWTPAPERDLILKFFYRRKQAH